MPRCKYCKEPATHVFTSGKVKVYLCEGDAAVFPSTRFLKPLPKSARRLRR